MAFINKRIEELINTRILEEERSSRLYLAMSKWLNFNGYVGAAKLWAKYAAEEQTHADKSYKYLEELDILPVIPALIEPGYNFVSLPDICKQSYEHEMLITNQCNDLAKAAIEEGDYMTLELAQSYLKEQVEELGKTMAWLDIIERQGGDSISKESIYLLDNQMGAAV